MPFGHSKTTWGSKEVNNFCPPPKLIYFLFFLQEGKRPKMDQKPLHNSPYIWLLTDLLPTFFGSQSSVGQKGQNLGARGRATKFAPFCERSSREHIGTAERRTFRKVVHKNTIKMGVSENPFPSFPVKNRIARKTAFTETERHSFCYFEPFSMKTPRNCRIARFFCTKTNRFRHSVNVFHHWKTNCYPRKGTTFNISAISSTF